MQATVTKLALLALLLQTGAAFDVYECRTAVLAAIGAVQGLFAAAPEPVAEPAKKGLAALFGR